MKNNSKNVLNSTPDAKPTYKDIFLEHYPNFDVSRFDEFAESLCVTCCFDDGACPFPVNGECKTHWESECVFEWRDEIDEYDLGTINEFLIEKQPESAAIENTAPDAKPTYKDIFLEHYPNFDVSRFDEFVEKLCVTCCFDDGGGACPFPDNDECKPHWESECVFEWRDEIDEYELETINEFLIEKQPESAAVENTAEEKKDIREMKEDFSKLDEIADPKRRDKLVELLGTPNFDYQYKRAVDEEKRAEKFNEVKEIIKSFAKKISEDEKDGLKDIDYINEWYAPNFKKPDDTDTVKYFYIIGVNGLVRLYREYTPDELKDCEQKKAENDAADEKRIRVKERLAELKKRSDIAAELRHEFVVQFDPLRGCSSQKEKLERYNKLLEFWVRTYILFAFDKYDSFECFLNNIGMDATEEFDEMDEDSQNKTVMEHIKKFRSPELKALFSITIAALETYSLKYYHGYGPTAYEYEPCSPLDMIYEILCAFGYEMSDEEKQLQNGTHELFAEGD